MLDQLRATTLIGADYPRKSSGSRLADSAVNRELAAFGKSCA